MPKARTKPEQFRARSIEDVFAVYLARELDDLARVRWYAALTARYSLCFLLNVLQETRKRARVEAVAPEQFVAVLGDLLAKEAAV